MRQIDPKDHDYDGSGERRLPERRSGEAQSDPDLDGAQNPGGEVKGKSAP